MTTEIHPARRRLQETKRLVIKVGSSLLHQAPVARPATIADDLAALSQGRELETVVISSGAISLGTRLLGWPKRPTALPALQAAAAVGQGHLMQNWEHAFSVHDRIIGQVLLTHDDLSDRRRFLNARHALFELLKSGVIPIVNENDTVAVEEIKYGDNDLLAALVANLVSADALIILTDVDGLFDAPPDQGGTRIPVVTDVDREAAPVATAAKAGGHGSGGMASKVQAAKAAARKGVLTAVACGRDPNVIRRLLGGEDLGTVFVPKSTVVSSRKHWIAYGSRPSAQIRVDEGAHRAISERGTSLLPAGVLDVLGEFQQGDIVSLLTPSGTEFARGLAGYSAAEMRRLKGLQSADIEATLGYKYLDELIHRDDLVLI